MGRAAHSLHAEEPVLDDFWAIELIAPSARALVRDPTLQDVAGLAAEGSRLVLDYACDVPLSAAQAAYQRSLRERLRQSDEPMHPPWRPAEFEALLTRCGFLVREHGSERDLEARYFASRSHGLAPTTPARVVVAERTLEPRLHS